MLDRRVSIVVEPAKIVDFEDIERLRPKLGRIVVASGGFDPLHPGHASNLLESKKLGDTLIALVNGDSFLRVKKGKALRLPSARWMGAGSASAR